jgi:rhamnosyltransferase
MGEGSGRVLGIVIAFKPDPRILTKVLATALPEVNQLVVIDNGSTDESRGALAAAAELLWSATPIPPPRIEIIANARNEGVSVAFNQGISRALTENFEFVFLLDQDSLVRSGSVQHLREVYRTLSAQFKVGALQAANVEPGGRITLDIRRRDFYRRHGGFENPNAFQGLLLLNSGALIPTHIFRSIGGFDERYFVDFVDYEFSLRLCERGYRMFHVPGAVIDHNVGQTAGPGPARLYYAVRELVKLGISYGSSQPGGVAPPAWTTLNRMVSLAIRSRHPFDVAALSLRGFFDGLLDVKGALATSDAHGR